MFRDEVSAQVRISPLPPRDLKPLASSDSTQWLWSTYIQSSQAREPLSSTVNISQLNAKWKVMTYLAGYLVLLLSLAVSSGALSDDRRDKNMSGPVSRVLDDMIGNFKSVELQAVWDELQSRKVVSFSVVRDSTQFLVVQAAWLLAGLLLWRGPAVTRRDLITGEERVELLEDKVFTETVDVSKLNNFFMNPQHVTRNLVVCASLVSLSVSILVHKS